MADCCETMDNIARRCGGGNKPGLKKRFHITCVDEITAIPAPGEDTHVISDDINMRDAEVGPPEVTAGVFRVWNISMRDASYTAEPQGDDENGSWLVTVKAFINKLDEATTYVLNGVNGGDYVALVPDGNGKIRVIGELDNGCTVKTKEQTNDKNGYELTITWETSHLPYFYTGAIAE